MADGRRKSKELAFGETYSEPPEQQSASCFYSVHPPAASPHFVLGESCWFGLQCRPTGTILLATNAAVRPGSRIYHPNYKESLENMKKLLTLLFAAALTLSLSSAAFAQDTSSSAPADKKEAKAEKKAAKKEKKAAKKEKKAEKKDEMKKDEPK